MRLGDAVRRLHESLPRWVNFSVGRSESQEVQCDEEGIRDPRQARGDAPQWSVVVQRPDRLTSKDRYVHATLGADLAAVVDEAVERYRQWEASVEAEGAGERTQKPSKLAAPGSADRRDRRAPRGRRKDAS